MEGLVRGIPRAFLRALWEKRDFESLPEPLYQRSKFLRAKPGQTIRS